jgi:hypothetical protein
MIKLLDILENKILVPLRSKEERSKNYQIALQKKVQQYIKDGSKGDLDLRGTPITSLPPDLKVGGNLDLRYCRKLTSLPSGLSFKGNLDLRGCENFTSLPSGLSVRGYLNLSYTKITSLPSGLSVEDYLNLSNTPITSLPSDLTVGGNFHLFNTPLSKSHTKEQIKQMAPGIKGYVFI